MCHAKEAIDLRFKEAMSISLVDSELNDRDERRDICTLLYIVYDILNYDFYTYHTILSFNSTKVPYSNMVPNQKKKESVI